MVGVTAADPPGAPASFSMRGFSGDQINTLYNGIRVGPSDDDGTAHGYIRSRSHRGAEGPGVADVR